MNKQEKIDLFLKQISLLSQNYHIDSNQIYLQLINQGISNEEREKDISSLFPKIEKENNKKGKLFVFNQGYWCQLYGANSSYILDMNPIKLYISLKSNNIDKSVKKIFDFIKKNKMPNVSKLAKNLRVDNLVIRVETTEDARKIIDFVNNDKELQENTNEPNPFCITEGKVAIAMDRALSYNSILSKYIYNYISETNYRNKTASYEDFKEYMNMELLNIKSETDLSNQVYIAQNAREGYNNITEIMKSIEEITYVINYVLNGNTKEDLFNYFEIINTDRYNREKQDLYIEFESERLAKNKYLLTEIIDTMVKRYGIDFTKKSLTEYRNIGNIYNITRQNNLREKVKDSKTFITYINMIDLDYEIEKNKPKLNSEQQNDIKTTKEMILEFVCKETYQVFETEDRFYSGKIQVESLLKSIKENNYRYITNKNNARMIAKQNIRPEEVENLVKKYLEVNGYIISNEDDLYKLYAEHIEYLCSNTKGRGRR